MRSTPRRLFCAAILAAGLACPAPAGARSPDIAPVQHFQFTPQPGTAWYLDGSPDGQAWSQQAGPFFATGAPVDHFQPAGPSREFRLRYVDPATIGPAPVVLAGTSVIMEKAGEPVEVIFMNAVRGILRLDDYHARSFTYTWTKTSANAGEAILTNADGTLTLLRLKFSDAALGQWGMEDIPNREASAQITQTLDSGAFSFREGRFRRGQNRATLPGDLAGRSIVFNEAGRHMHAKFTGATTATVTTAKGQTLDCTYAYDPESTSLATLHLHLPNIAPLGLRLELNAPGAGQFRDVPQAGQPPVRNGTFTLPDEQVPPPNPNCPPPSIAGLSFLIRDSAPCTLTFLADGSGYISKDVNGALQITPFLYSYSCTGGRSAKVSLVFPGGGGDAIDDYDMEWKDDCTGDFTRESFANGSAAGTKSGTFGPGQDAALGGAPPPGLGM
jgi:hypothetical protein